MFNKIENYNNSGLTSYEISTECVKLATAMKRMIKKYPELSGEEVSILEAYEFYGGDFSESDNKTYRYIVECNENVWHICIMREEEQQTEEQPTSEEQIESIMLCDSDGNEIYLTNTVADMCRYIQENHKNIIGNVYMAHGTYNTKTKYFEKNDYSEYVDFIEMFAGNFTISINEILGKDDTIVNSYSGTETIPHTAEQTDKQTEKASEYPARISNYNGVAYPEKEDCKTCIWRSDCKHKITYQFNDTCEMYLPTSLYL